MKVGAYAMLRLYKGYFISFSAGITKKLTKQYIGLFCILKKEDQFAYKLDILLD